MELPCERRIAFEQRGRVKGAPREIAEAIGGAGTRALPVVEEAEPPLALVHEIVRTVTNESHAGPLGHVRVVGDVDEELGERVLLDPAMKDGNECVELHGPRRLGGDEDLELELLRIHLGSRWFPATYAFDATATAVFFTAAPRRS